MALNLQSKLLELEELSDFTIRCNDVEFKVHKLILCAQSEYFKVLCIGNGVGKPKLSLTVHSKTPKVVEYALNCIYTIGRGNVDYNILIKRLSDMIDIYLLLDEWGITDCFNDIDGMIVPKIQNICEYLKLVWNRPGCNTLKSRAIQKIIEWSRQDIMYSEMHKKPKHLYLSDVGSPTGIMKELETLPITFRKQVFKEISLDQIAIP